MLNFLINQRIVIVAITIGNVIIIKVENISAIIAVTLIVVVVEEHFRFLDSSIIYVGSNTTSSLITTDGAADCMPLQYDFYKRRR